MSACCFDHRITRDLRMADQDEQADGQHVERRQAPMDQDLVDNHLKEQRRDQRKELQKERGDQYLGE